jgi:thiamine biosynthesis protein ThiI
VKPTLIIIRYGEIWLKSEPTKKQFENQLIQNIKNNLKKQKISFEIKTQRGRIYLHTEQIKQTTKVLTKTFGITSTSPATQTISTIESMTKHALTIAEKQLSKKQTFALRITREGKHNYTSQDIAVKLGDKIRKKTQAKVNLTQPDYTQYIEIRNQNAYFYTEKKPGPGGLPMGTQGNVLAIIDTKQSILAAWYLMRRGCQTVLMITKKTIQPTVRKLLKTWHVKPETIENKKPNKTITNNYNCKAIITGHTFSKENIAEIKQIKKQTNLPVLTPLIYMDRKQIQQKTKEIELTK